MDRLRGCVLLVALIVPACAGDKAASDAAAPPPGPSTPSTNLYKDVAFVCPMDRDVRSNDPGKCPRCGMQLVAGVPEPTEYHLDLTVHPEPARPKEPVRLAFQVSDPWKDNPVTKFSVVHEKLFHAFIVSRDLQFFVHDHPTYENGTFNYEVCTASSATSIRKGRRRS
jgi:hypothetical protein